MKREDNRATETRRGFLRLAGLAPVAAGAAVVAGGGEAEAATPEAGKSQGYHETPHVRQAYETARF